jgi:hypothetical protein
MRYDHPPEAGCLRKLRRFAIWNREKFITIIAMCVWMTDVAFFIYGKYFLRIIGVHSQTEARDIIGSVTVRVNFSVNYFGLTRLN